MKFSINKTEFLNALGIAGKGIASRSTIPILSGVYIKTLGTSLELKGTDSERAIRCTVSALIDEDGECVVPERLLYDIVKSFPDAAITMEVDETQALISCDKTSFTLKVFDPADFPAFPDIDVNTKASISFKAFSQAVKRVAKVASKDQGRPALTGVLITTIPDGMRLVATDSYRLAMDDIPCENPTEGFEALVSGSFMQEVASLPEKEESIEICLSSNHVVFTYGSIVFINRRIEARFPNYQQLLTDSYTTRTEFETAGILAAVRRVGLMSSLSAPIKFDIESSTATALLSTVSQDMGSAEESLSCGVEGENIEIALNHQYVVDGLSSIPTDKVFLETRTSMMPGIFRAQDPERFLYLLMPVHI